MYEKHLENLLDMSLADTFPASDPLSITQPGGGTDTRRYELPWTTCFKSSARAVLQPRSQ